MDSIRFSCEINGKLHKFNIPIEQSRSIPFINDLAESITLTAEQGLLMLAETSGKDPIYIGVQPSIVPVKKYFASLPVSISPCS